MQLLLILATSLLAACTYGPAQDRVTVENLAITPDGSRLAVVVKYERYRVATGLAAFPDGGVPRVLAQRADLYVVDLRSRTMLYRGGLPAPATHRVSFSPWLVGWKGDTLYFQITGCPGSPGDECWGPLVKKSVFSLSPQGRIDSAVLGSPGPTPASSIERDGDYLSAGTEAYGVSIARTLGGPWLPLMRFDGVRLELVPADVPGAA